MDIAVDLKGETGGSRWPLFLLGLAPIQVNYLGFPGTMGTRAYDYIIADDTVAPFAEARKFDETILHLPGTYLPVDEALITSERPARLDHGLPTEGVVMACFNSHYKLSRRLFGL